MYLLSGMNNYLGIKRFLVYKILLILSTHYNIKNMNNLYQTQIINYLEQVYKSQPKPDKFVSISSHQVKIPTSGKFTFPKLVQTDTNSNIRYFISGISISQQDDNLAQLSAELVIQIISAGQTWISGQLGLLNPKELKDLIIPLPAVNVEQEIELLIQDYTAEKKPKFVVLNFDVIVAPDFHGDELTCYRQIIYPVPETGIIYDGRNTILCSITNRIARIEVYVPDNLYDGLQLDKQPKIYCDDLAIKPSTNQDSRDCDSTTARTHNQVSGMPPGQIQAGQKPDIPGQPQFLGYKTYCFDAQKSGANSVIKLDQTLQGQLQKIKNKIKYSIIEKQIVRMKNGYIGLAF